MLGKDIVLGKHEFLGRRKISEVMGVMGEKRKFCTEIRKLRRYFFLLSVSSLRSYYSDERLSISKP